MEFISTLQPAKCPERLKCFLKEYGSHIKKGLITDSNLILRHLNHV